MRPAIIELRRQRLNPEIIAINDRTASTTFIKSNLRDYLYQVKPLFGFLAFYAFASTKFTRALSRGHNTEIGALTHFSFA